MTTVTAPATYARKHMTSNFGISPDTAVHNVLNRFDYLSRSCESVFPYPDLRDLYTYEFTSRNRRQGILVRSRPTKPNPTDKNIVTGLIPAKNIFTAKAIPLNEDSTKATRQQSGSANTSPPVKDSVTDFIQHKLFDQSDKQTPSLFKAIPGINLVAMKRATLRSDGRTATLKQEEFNAYLTTLVRKIKTVCKVKMLSKLQIKLLATRLQKAIAYALTFTVTTKATKPAKQTPPPPKVKPSKKTPVIPPPATEDPAPPVKPLTERFTPATSVPTPPEVQETPHDDNVTSDYAKKYAYQALFSLASANGRICHNFGKEETPLDLLQAAFFKKHAPKNYRDESTAIHVPAYSGNKFGALPGSIEFVLMSSACVANTSPLLLFWIDQQIQLAESAISAANILRSGNFSLD